MLSDAESIKRVTGTVLATGHGLYTGEGYLIPLQVKVLDRVRFRENFGDDFTLFGNDYHCLKEQDIMCLLPCVPLSELDKQVSEKE